MELVPDSDAGFLSRATELSVWCLTSDSRDADWLVRLQVNVVLSESLDIIMLEREACLLRLIATRLSRDKPIELMLLVDEAFMMERGCLSRLAAAKFSVDCVETRVFGSRYRGRISEKRPVGLAAVLDVGLEASSDMECLNVRSFVMSGAAGRDGTTWMVVGRGWADDTATGLRNFVTLSIYNKIRLISILINRKYIITMVIPK